MYRVAVVEDEQVHQEKAVKYLKRYGEMHGMEFDISVFNNGGVFLMRNYSGYDIIFMDIDMPVVNGMQTAREIRKTDSQVVIVFITNMAGYAVQGYEVEALDFIVKPLRYEVFEFKMTRIMGRVAKRQAAEPLVLETKDGLHKLALEDLIYVDVDHHVLTYHTKHGDISLRGSMGDAEMLLEGKSFFKCNQCYLVNLRYVTKVEESDVFLGKTQLRISRGNKKKLMNAISEYMTTA